MRAGEATKALLTQDGRVLVQQPDGSFRLAEGRTDWARVRDMTEEEVEANAASDPDAPPLDDEFSRTAKVLTPPAAPISTRT